MKYLQTYEFPCGYKVKTCFNLGVLGLLGFTMSFNANKDLIKCPIHGNNCSKK